MLDVCPDDRPHACLVEQVLDRRELGLIRPRFESYLGDDLLVVRPEAFNRPGEDGLRSAFSRHRLFLRVGRGLWVVRVVAAVGAPAHDPQPRLILARADLALAEVLNMLHTASRHVDRTVTRGPALGQWGPVPSGS